jgi:hypothetical protein
MGARDHVLVKVTRCDAALVARWLHATAIPTFMKRHDTALTPGYNVEVVQQLRELASIFEKAARRKRDKEVFSLLIPKAGISAMESAVTPDRYPTPGFIHPLFTLADGISRVADAMRDAAKSKRGRPRLSKLERDERIVGELSVEERHRKRLKRSKRADDVWASYIREMMKRGETFLTTSIPPPKI